VKRAEPGFALTELLVAMVIAGVIGIALTRLVINQARFVGMQDGMMRARGGARAALNAMTAELRTITTDGLIQASRDSVTLRIPYAYGLACSQSGGATMVSLLPADSATFASASLSGYAWRDSLGQYIYVQPATASPGSTSFCTSLSPPINTLPGNGWAATVRALYPNDPATPAGAPVYMYQIVRYSFAPSGQLSGRRALWRTVLSSGARDELVTPFDTSARFEFLVGPTLEIQSTPPPDLNQVRGLRVRLVASSENPPQGRTAPVTFDLSTDLLFRNNVQ
jgi:prepilin-type N-terminal cleavage/methylation domain-containing protein